MRCKRKFLNQLIFIVATYYNNRSESDLNIPNNSLSPDIPKWVEFFMTGFRTFILAKMRAIWLKSRASSSKFQTC